MKNIDAPRALALAAGAVIIALTAAAFWLSYAHLAEVALGHGLKRAPERAWAWPACLDLFIMAGETMWLRAALAHRVDWWAIVLTVIGSGGSIALNVAGVGTTADHLDYVVAAVPPTAALLAFGALMRQVHQALAGYAQVVSGIPDTAGFSAPVAVLVERADQPPVIKVPALVPDMFAEKAYKELPAAVPEPPAEPEPELTAIGFLARRHKVRSDQIRTAVDLLAEQPSMSGKALGDALETTDRYGRRVLAAAKELAGVRS